MRDETGGVDGPRGLRPEELPSLKEMTGVVFRTGLVDEYPQLFFEDNYENLRVCVVNGRVASHVGMTTQKASLFGSVIQVGCIGGVGTHPDFRNRGFASLCFDSAVEKAYRDGTDIFMVSGDRNLYRMRGCMRVGSDTTYTLKAGESLAGLDRLPSVTVEELSGEEDLPLLIDLYRREPVRFLRSSDIYQREYGVGFVMNRPARFLLVRENGNDAPCAYLIIARRGEDAPGRIVEFAGDRRALIAALPQAIDFLGLNEIGWHVMRWDTRLRSVCESAGLKGDAAETPGTVKLINYPQLMERMRPYFEEILGSRRAARLSFRQSGDEYAVRYGDDEAVLSRDDMTRLLFGTMAGEERRHIEGHGELTEILSTILPLPSLWYGMNYV